MTPEYGTISLPRKYVLASFEPPSFGGASTSAYQLFKKSRGAIDAAFFSLVEPAIENDMKASLGADYGNPERLPEAYTRVLTDTPFRSQPGLSERLAREEPNVLVGIGYIAAYVLNKALPHLPLVLVTTGCQQAKDALEDGFADTSQRLLKMLEAGRGLRITNDAEATAFENADTIVCHSPLIKKLCELYFPGQSSKMLSDVVWFSDWIYESAERFQHFQKRFCERSIDVCFVASDWDRFEKNFDLVKEISNGLRGRCIHLIGRSRAGLPGAVGRGLLSNHQVMEALADTKVLVCPSSFDAAPGILFEGAALGSNLVASRNCGNWQLLHPSLLVNHYTVDDFVEKIELALSGFYPNNIGYFQKERNHPRLMQVLGEVGAPGSTCGVNRIG